jgi:hypothetical protein
MHMAQITDTKGAALNWARFDGLTDLADHFDQIGERYRGRDDFDPWCGAYLEDARRFIRDGNLALVEQSDRLMTELEGKMDFGAHIARNLPAVAGGAPCVPAFLSNSPMSMRQRRRVVTDLAPITVIVNVSAAQACTKDQIQRRGAAVLALVRLLAVQRPTTLVLTVGYDDGQRCLLTVAMDTAPLDLARAAWALTQPEFLRRFMFAAAAHACNLSGDDFGGNPLMGEMRGKPEIAAGALGFSEYVASARLMPDDFRDGQAASAWLLARIKELSRLPE